MKKTYTVTATVQISAKNATAARKAVKRLLPKGTTFTVAADIDPKPNVSPELLKFLREFDMDPCGLGTALADLDDGHPLFSEMTKLVKRYGEDYLTLAITKPDDPFLADDPFLPC